MDRNTRTELVLDAPQTTVSQRQPPWRHPPYGSRLPCSSYAFGKRREETGIMPSIGWAGDAYDNTVAENFCGPLEQDELNRRRFKSQAEARMAIFEWMVGWYQPHHRYSEIGHHSPVNFERSYWQEKHLQKALLPPPGSEQMSDTIAKAT